MREQSTSLVGPYGSKQQEALAETYYPLVACGVHEAVRSGAFPGRKERSEGIGLIAYQPPPK
jgi:hypothetical protein